jgi:hypothetical protein
MKKMKNHECPTFQSVFKWSPWTGWGGSCGLGWRVGKSGNPGSRVHMHCSLSLADLVTWLALFSHHPHSLPFTATL